MGWPSPIDANAVFLLLPCGNAPVMIMTAKGRQKGITTPAKARKMMSCVPVRAKPHAGVSAGCRRQPRRDIGFAPTILVTEARSRRVHPQVKAYMYMGLAS
jgi:hypothetical protein